MFTYTTSSTTTDTDSWNSIEQKIQCINGIQSARCVTTNVPNLDKYKPLPVATAAAQLRSHAELTQEAARGASIPKAMAPHTTEADASAAGGGDEESVEAGTLRHRHNAAKADDAEGEIDRNHGKKQNPPARAQSNGNTCVTLHWFTTVLAIIHFQKEWTRMILQTATS